MHEDSDSHPGEARLAAYLDGELGEEARASVARHLERCSPCSDTLAELRRSAESFSEAVSALTPPAPETTAEELRRRASRRDDGGGGPAGEEEERVLPLAPRRWSTATRVAASLAVLFGAAAALPGSPIRGWVGESVQRVQVLLGGQDDRRPAVEAEPAERDGDADERSGVAVASEDGSFTIVLEDVPGTAAIRVRQVDGPRAAVWNADGDYGTAAGRIQVRSPSSDEILVEVPRSARRVRLEVNGRLAAVKRDGELEATLPVTGAAEGGFTIRPPGTP